MRRLREDKGERIGQGRAGETDRQTEVWMVTRTSYLYKGVGRTGRGGTGRDVMLQGFINKVTDHPDKTDLEGTK